MLKTVVGRLVLAVVAVVAGIICWNQSGAIDRAADAYQRLVTLRYDRDDSLGVAPADAAALPWPLTEISALSTLTLEPGVRRQEQAAVAYWRREYGTLTDPLALADAAGADAASDPALMMLAANAAFRQAQANAADRIRTVERLDGVISTYAEVLRAAPEMADASFNYEYASRFRDSIASGKPMSRGARARAAAEAMTPPVPSADLPIGPTLHGRPGGPPPEIPGSDFKTIAPMPYDEREQTDPGRGATPRRRG
jgi:hypothetical protein